MRQNQRMLIHVWLFVCLALKFPGSVYSSNIEKYSLQTDGEKDVIEGQKRVIRTTIKIFQAALGAILEAAKEVPTKVPNTKKFIKTGTVNDARRDFLSLGPVFPDGKEVGFTGTVENFKVAYKFSDRRQGRRPSLLIADPFSKDRIRIVYIKPKE